MTVFPEFANHADQARPRPAAILSLSLRRGHPTRSVSCKGGSIVPRQQLKADAEDRRSAQCPRWVDTVDKVCDELGMTAD
jgi:hypothetical protein